MEYLHSTGFSNDAKRRILAGEDPQGLVHIIWGGEAPSGLSSTLTLVEYQRGGVYPRILHAGRGGQWPDRPAVDNRR